MAEWIATGGTADAGLRPVSWRCAARHRRAVVVDRAHGGARRAESDRLEHQRPRRRHRDERLDPGKPPSVATVLYYAGETERRVHDMFEAAGIELLSERPHTVDHEDLNPMGHGVDVASG